MKLRAALIDDHPIVLESLRAQFRHSGWEIAGEARDYASAFLLLNNDPTIRFAIVDWNLPSGSGVKLVQSLGALRPDLRCLMLTGFPSKGLIDLAYAAGAVGVVSKTTGPRQLQWIAAAAIADAQWQLDRDAAESQKLPSLDDQEIILLNGLAHGFSSREIAKSNNLPAPTLKLLGTKLRDKLGLTSPIEIVDAARRHGALSEEVATRILR